MDRLAAQLRDGVVVVVAVAIPLPLVQRVLLAVMAAFPPLPLDNTSPLFLDLAVRVVKVVPAVVAAAAAKEIMIIHHAHL